MSASTTTSRPTSRTDRTSTRSEPAPSIGATFAGWALVAAVLFGGSYAALAWAADTCPAPATPAATSTCHALAAVEARV